MYYADVIEGFLDLCGRGTSAVELAAGFRNAMGYAGIRYFACCSHTDPRRCVAGSVMEHNYSDDWVDIYSRSGLHRIDPVFRYAECNELPFDWDGVAFRSRLTLEQEAVMQAASGFGLRHGRTIPLHGPYDPNGLPGSCSVVPASASIGVRTYLTVELLASRFYHAIRSIERPAVQQAADAVLLSHRERQCLIAWGRGNSDAETAADLRISESTVRTHINRILERQQVSKRIQGVVQALTDRQIELRDLCVRGARR